MTAPAHILALDIGTSSVKAAVLDRRTGDPAGPVAKVDYDLAHPTPDAAEVDAGHLWDAISQAATAALESAPAPGGVGLSTLTPALVLLDAAGRPVAPIRIHLDRRSRPVARRVLADRGPAFLAETGNRPLPGGISAVTYAQLATDLPAVPGRVAHYLHANGWVAWKLTGRFGFDPGSAGFTGLFGTLTDQQWSAEWCGYFGVNRAWLPPVLDGRATVGGLTADAANAWGLAAGVPVKLGVPDTSSAMLAVGLGPGELLHVVGTTQVLGVITPTPAPAADRLTRRLGAGPAFVAIVHNPVGGVALDFLHQLAFRDVPAADFFDRAVPAAADRPTAVKLDPPYLGGDRLQVEPRAAGFTGVTLGTTRDDLLAAVVAAMRAGHTAALATVGFDPAAGGRVYLTGGGAEVVRRVLPEYARAAVTMVTEGSLRGCARLFDDGPEGDR